MEVKDYFMLLLMYAGGFVIVNIMLLLTILVFTEFQSSGNGLPLPSNNQSAEHPVAMQIDTRASN